MSATRTEDAVAEDAVAEAGGAEDAIAEAGTVENVEESSPVSVPKTRDYHVLKAEVVDIEPAHPWTALKEVGTYNAGTSAKAVEAAASEHGLGEYVAVAASAWNEHKAATVEVEPQLVIS